MCILSKATMGLCTRFVIIVKIGATPIRIGPSVIIAH